MLKNDIVVEKDGMFAIKSSKGIQRYANADLTNGALVIKGSSIVSLETMQTNQTQKYDILVAGSDSDTHPTIRIGIERLDMDIKLKNETPVGSEVVIRYTTENDSNITIVESGQKGRVRIIKNGCETSNRGVNCRPARKWQPMRRLDYRNHDDLAIVYNSYGGKDVMEVNYPLSYQIVQNTIENPPEEPKAPLTTVDVGAFDIYPPLQQNADGNTSTNKLFTKCGYQTCEPNIVCAQYKGAMEYSNGDRISSFDEYIEREVLDINNHPEIELAKNMESIEFRQGGLVLANTILRLTYKTKTSRMFTGDSKPYTIFNGPTVASMKVTDPVAKDGSTEIIKVGYWHYYGVDYSYSVGYDVENVPIKLDFTGIVTFSSGLTIEDATLVVMKVFKRQENAITNKCTVEESRSYLTRNGNKLTISFPADWGTTENLKNFLVNNVVELDFYCDIYITSKTARGSTLYTTLTIRSSINEDEYYTSKNKPIVYLPKIRLIWDCYATGTSLTMNDGKTKNVELLNVGDVIMTPDGTGRTVTQVFKAESVGHSRFFTIAAGGKTICITEYHSLILKDGTPICANELKVGDILQLSGGQTAAVTSISVRTSTEPIYNLMTVGNSGSLIIANGFITMDLYYKNSLPKPLPDTCEGIMTEEEKVQLKEEIKRHAEDNRIIGLDLNPQAIIL